MATKEIAYKIEKLQTDAEKINSITEALFVALYRQDEYGKEEYEWAFISLSEMTMKLRDDLEKLTNEAFDSYRKEAS